LFFRYVVRLVYWRGGSVSRTHETQNKPANTSKGLVTSLPFSDRKTNSKEHPNLKLSYFVNFILFNNGYTSP